MSATGPGAPAQPTTADREIVISRVISAPRALVFEAFTEVRHLSRWWGPAGFTTTTRAFEFRVGGVWDSEWIDSLKQSDADDAWRDKLCGNDNGTEYSTQIVGGGKAEEKFQAPGTIAELTRRPVVTDHRVSSFTFATDPAFGTWTARHETTLTFRRVRG